jgi:LmbE family N-acetylglucosaminyl deacetylase
LTANEYLQLVDCLPVKTLHELTGGRPIVVLSPHPDDESLGAGGLIALARWNGQDVAVILMTDGSKSHPNSKAYPKDRLIATRRSEIVNATCILGVFSDRLFELGLPDAAPLSAGDFERSAERIAEVVALIGAGALFVTWEHDPHCDHEIAARLAREVRARHPHLKLWSYPVWGWHLPASHILEGPAPKGVRLDIANVLPQKRAAIRAHVSQMTDLIDDDPTGFRFDAQALAPFLREKEHYIEVPLS